jgi:hypothetical protein
VQHCWQFWFSAILLSPFCIVARINRFCKIDPGLLLFNVSAKVPEMEAFLAYERYHINFASVFFLGLVVLCEMI